MNTACPRRISLSLGLIGAFATAFQPSVAQNRINVGHPHDINTRGQLDSEPAIPGRDLRVRTPWIS
jgi:hypothetical protein